MKQIDPEVREYIASDESMTRVTILQRHEGLKERLKTPETRRGIIDWLGTAEAWQDANAGFVNKCIQFLNDGAKEAEADTIRPFLLHGDPFVRLRASEFLITLYFPDRNPEALLGVLQIMLLDREDAVRTAGLRYVERAALQDRFHAFLERWVALERGRGVRGTESLEVAERLLGR